MAVLDETGRAAVWREFMDRLSADRDAVGSVTKADLRAAVDALDTWLDDNVTALNQALPTAARTALSPAQKARLLSFVVLRRYRDGA